MDQNQPQNGRTDHDLLIELATKLDRAITDISALNTNVVKSTADLQQSKVDKDTFTKWEGDFRRDFDKEINALKEKLLTDLGAIGKVMTETFKDHEDRLRRLERWGFIAIGALSIIQIIVGIAK